MKYFTTFLIACAAALGIYSARQRLILALKTGAIVYLVLLPLRLLLSAGSLLGEIQQLIWPIIALLVGWVVLWYASTEYERRKDEARRPPPAG